MFPRSKYQEIETIRNLEVMTSEEFSAKKPFVDRTASHLRDNLTGRSAKENIEFTFFFNCTERMYPPTTTRHFTFAKSKEGREEAGKKH